MTTKSELFLLFLLIFAKLPISVSSQDSQNTSFQYDYQQEEFEIELLECNFCKHSYRRKDLVNGNFQEPDCLNHLKFLSRPDLRKTCAVSEKYCVSIVTNLNGFFIEIERDCAINCKKGCEERGFGLFHTTCTRCCQSPLCNELDDKKYYKPLSASGLATFLVLAFTIFLLFI